MTSSTLKSVLQSDSKYKLMVAEIEIRKVSKYLVLQPKKFFKELLNNKRLVIWLVRIFFFTSETQESIPGTSAATNNLM